MECYDNSKIYYIESPCTKLIYIGSTTQPLKNRMGNHESLYKYWLDGKTKYNPLFKILKYGDCKIKLIDEFKCGGRKELRIKHREYIEKAKLAQLRVVDSKTTKK